MFGPRRGLQERQLCPSLHASSVSSRERPQQRQARLLGLGPFREALCPEVVAGEVRKLIKYAGIPERRRLYRHVVFSVFMDVRELGRYPFGWPSYMVIDHEPLFFLCWELSRHVQSGRTAGEGRLAVLSSTP